jgi:hypothetical protein
MSTRGAYGFKINNQTKVIMSPYDSYPGGLGADIINFLQKVDLTRLKEKAQSLQPIPQSLIKDNPLAEKDIWREPTQVLQGIYTGTLQSYFEAKKFLEDLLFCEYAYLINFDTNLLECYESGTALSLGSYDLKDLSEVKVLKSINKCVTKNAAAKAELLGYAHYGKKKQKL